MRVLKIVSYVLAGLVILLLALLLFLDVLVKFVIESEGSKALGARVELASADVNLFESSVTLSDLRVTNPLDTSKDALRAGTVKADVDPWPLLNRQVVIDQAVLSGLRFQQERQTDGAIPGLESPFAGSASPGQSLQQDFRLPELDLPDSEELLGRLDLATVRQAEALEARINEREAHWKARIDQLPNEETLKGYEQRLRAVRDEKDLVKRIAALKDIEAVRQSFQRDLSTIRSAASELQTDISSLQQDINRLQQAGKEDVGRAMALVGLNPESLNELARALLGEEVGAWLDQGWYWYQTLQPILAGTAATDANAPATTEAGEATPPFLIRELLIDGEIAPPGHAAVSFNGKGSNLTDRADLWGVPAKLALQGAGEGLSLDIQALLDHVNPAAAKDSLNWQLSGLGLSDLRLSDDASFPLRLASAILDSQGSASLVDGELDLRLDALFQALELATGELPSGDSRSAQLQKALLQALSDLEQFGLTVLASGDPVSPDFRFESSLNKVLGQAVGGLFRAEQAALEQRLNRKVQALVAERSDALASQLGDLRGLDGSIAALLSQFGRLP